MLGYRLKEIRTKRNHTQESLAEIVGTNARQVWRWESGESEPNNDYLVSIARALDVSTDYLLGLSDDPQPTDNGLSLIEQRVLIALRRGEKYKAVEEIVRG